MARLFISYRRDDSADVVGRISDRLVQHFGQDHVFTDVDSIPPGVNFVEYLDDQVAQCDIFLSAIGPLWLSLLHSLKDEPKDLLRIEIESALKRNIPVVPLLVRGASLPIERELPASLSELSYRHAATIRSGSGFHGDVDRLIKGLEQHEITIDPGDKRSMAGDPEPRTVEEKELSERAHGQSKPMWEQRQDARRMMAKKGTQRAREKAAKEAEE